MVNDGFGSIPAVEFTPVAPDPGPSTAENLDAATTTWQVTCVAQVATCHHRISIAAHAPTEHS